MRWLVLLLLVPSAAAQSVPVDLSLEYLGEELYEPTHEATMDVAFEVRVECGSPVAFDFNDHFTLHFDLNGTLAAADPIESEDLPTGLCAFASFGTWSKVYNLTVRLDQSQGSPEGDVVALLNTTVAMTSTNEQFAEPAEPVEQSAAWFLLGPDARVDSSKEPPVPQAQTTPGPALPLLAGALLLAALRRRA